MSPGICLAMWAPLVLPRLLVSKWSLLITWFSDGWAAAWRVIDQGVGQDFVWAACCSAPEVVLWSPGPRRVPNGLPVVVFEARGIKGSACSWFGQVFAGHQVYWKAQWSCHWTAFSWLQCGVKVCKLKDSFCQYGDALSPRVFGAGCCLFLFDFSYNWEFKSSTHFHLTGVSWPCDSSGAAIGEDTLGSGETKEQS